MVEKKTEIFIELAIVGFISYFLFFVSTNVNPMLGNIYQGLASLGLILAIVDITYGRKTLGLINRRISWSKAFLISLVAYVVLIATSFFVAGFAKAIPLTELLSLLGASAPIFSASSSINFLIFAIVIPYIETYVIFCIAIDLFSTMFKITPNRKNIFKTGLVILIIAITIAFLLFHVNAKGIENESALILVGIMGLISCVLIVWFEEFRIAILFHCICNILASLPTASILGLG